MKQRVSLFILWLLSAVIVHSADLDVRLTLANGKRYTGVLKERVGQNVSFQRKGGPEPAMVPGAAIALLEFKFDSEQQKKMQALLEAGRYEELAAELNAFMPDYLIYAAFPSNLEEMLTAWFAASYWTADYEQVNELMAITSKVKSDNLANHSLFYGMLTRMEQGDAGMVDAFLGTSRGAQVFPEESAARLYIDARRLQLDKQYARAIRVAAKLLAKHGRDADWAPIAELLCAELYFQTGRPESAKTVLGSIKKCYTSPLITKKAAAIAAQNAMENK